MKHVAVFPTLAQKKQRNVFCPARTPPLTMRKERNYALNQPAWPATVSARRDISAWRWGAGEMLSTSELTSTRIHWWPTTTVLMVATAPRSTTWPAPELVMRKNLISIEQTLLSSRYPGDGGGLSQLSFNNLNCSGGENSHWKLWKISNVDRGRNWRSAYLAWRITAAFFLLQHHLP